MSRHFRSIFVPCVLALGLIAACNKSKDDAAKSTDAAAEKSDDSAPAGEAKPADGAKPAAPTGTPPKGKDAPENLKPVVDALALFESCKIDEKGENFVGECPGFDKFTDIVSEQEDDKAVDLTLINLLGESNDAVRWAAADQLGSGDWTEDPVLVSTVLTAIASEKREGIVRMLSSDISLVEEQLLVKDPVLPVLTSTLSVVTDNEAFTDMLPTTLEESSEGWLNMLVTVSMKNPSLENRAYAAGELLDLDTLHPEACATVTAVVIELSKAKAVDPDSDEFDPHYEADNLIYSIRSYETGEGDKKQDCAAVLPGLIEQAQAQAQDGTLAEDVFDSILSIDEREDFDSYKAALTTLAEAVSVGQFSEDMKEIAKDALEDWKEG